MPGTGPCTNILQRNSSTGNVTNYITYGQINGYNGTPNDPFFAWGNTVNGVELDGLAAYPIVATNTNYVNGVSRPGYTAFTYPHPLTQASIAPIITQNPQSQTVPSGSNVTFTGMATGTPTITYQWYYNNSPISAATQTSYTISGATSGNAGAYYLVASNGEGSTTSSVANLTIGTATPPTIVTQPVGQNVPLGGTASIYVVASGSSPLSYTWFQGGNIAQGFNSPVFNIINAMSANSGSYDVVITNAYGAVTSSVTVLNVVPYITLTGGPGLLFHGGTNLTLASP
jgi:hypothetical protein